MFSSPPEIREKMGNGFDVSSISSEDEERVVQIQRRIDEFLTALEKNTAVNFTGDAVENKLLYVKVHIEVELRNEKEIDVTKTIISY